MDFLRKQGVLPFCAKTFPMCLTELMVRELNEEEKLFAKFLRIKGKGRKNYAQVMKRIGYELEGEWSDSDSEGENSEDN